MDRPASSRARGICKYYDKPRGCFAGDNCKFLHGEKEKLTPYDQAKICRWYTKGYCRNGDKCWFRHVTLVASSSKSPITERGYEEDNEENMCCICLEKPTTYGLLMGCNHVFCIDCIRQWRDPQGKSEDVVFSGVTKKCPLCRAPSRCIIPSSIFFPHGSSEKEAAIETYKASMARVRCRFFEDSKKSLPFCPFGKDCFYRHVMEDGTPYVFTKGVDLCMKIYARQRRHRPNTRAGVFFTIDSVPGISVFGRPRAEDPMPLHNVVDVASPSSSLDWVDSAILDTVHESLRGEHSIGTGGRISPPARLTWTVEDALINPEVPPSLSPSQEIISALQAYNRESEQGVPGTDAESNLEGTFPDQWNDWMTSLSIDDPTSPSGLLFSTTPGLLESVVSTDRGALDPPDFGSTSQPNDLVDENYPPNDCPYCSWCRQAMFSPHVQDFYPIAVMDAVDEEVVVPSGNEIIPSVTDPDPATSGPELPETDRTETDVAGNLGASQQIPCPDPRGRVNGNAVVRGNSGSRGARGRIGGGGKPTSGEKTPGDEAGGEGFMTDGRGRVIGTSEGVWQGDELGALGDRVEDV